MKLYELTDNYNQVLDMIEEGAEGLEDTLASIDEAIEQKAENTAKIIKTIEANASVLREEEKRLADRRRALENQVDGMKSFLESELRKAGKDKVKGLILTIAIQKNPPSLNVTDEAKIPTDYFIPQPAKLDRKTLLSYLKEGNSLDGAEIVQGESLRIR